MQVPGDHDLAALEKEFSTKRGANSDREYSLFKTFLSAEVYLTKFPSPIVGITPKLIYDRVKFGFEVGKVKPEQLSGRDQNEILVAMKHIAGDVDVEFEVVDQRRQLLAKAVGTSVKIGTSFVVLFDPIPNFYGKVELVIIIFIYFLFCHLPFLTGILAFRLLEPTIKNYKVNNFYVLK